MASSTLPWRVISTGLVDGTDHAAQIALITDLAAEMATDPSEGTNPDKILTGLRSYIEKRGFTFTRLELATWRGVSRDNQSFLIGRKPDLASIARAAEDPDSVVILNFGWYRESADGGYSRQGGHWVHLLGTGPGDDEFQILNPLLPPKRQASETAITLRMVEDDFRADLGNGKDTPMTGFYEAEGVGLPFNRKTVAAAVLDAVIIFTLEKE